MNRISISQLIEFRNRKSDNSKKGFLARILAPKPVKADGEKAGSGGHHWSSSLSAITHSFKDNDPQVIKNKIVELKAKLNDPTFSKKDMCLDNIKVLTHFENFDFSQWRPDGEITVLKNQNSILNIKGLPIKITPRSIYLTEKNEVGAIWLMGTKKGLSNQERGMFADALYMDMKNRYNRQYKVNSDYCLAIDMISNVAMSYTQLKESRIPRILKPTVDEVLELWNSR